MESGDESISPIGAIIGHWFAEGEVHIVFRDEDGRQFVLVKSTEERIYGNFLAPGEAWAYRDVPSLPKGLARAQPLLKAIHEAGHAVICIDEGIKVEYVTIIRSTGWTGIERLGFCQYDYRLPDLLRQDGSRWAAKTAKAHLGDPWADYIYRTRNGLRASKDLHDAWNYDRNEAAKCLADEARRAVKKINVERQLSRLDDAVKARFQEAWFWDVTCAVANKLCDEGAISGQVVKEFVDEAKTLYSVNDA